MRRNQTTSDLSQLFGQLSSTVSPPNSLAIANLGKLSGAQLRSMCVQLLDSSPLLCHMCVPTPLTNTSSPFSLRWMDTPEESAVLLPAGPILALSYVQLPNPLDLAASCPLRMMAVIGTLSCIKARSVKVLDSGLRVHLWAIKGLSTQLDITHASWALCNVLGRYWRYTQQGMTHSHTCSPTYS